MQMRSGYWHELEVGAYIADSSGKPFVVKDMKDGWVLLGDAAGVDLPVAPMHPDTPVQIYVLDEGEALDLLEAQLGATIVMRMETYGTQANRASRLTCATPASAAEFRSHLSIMHGQDDLGDKEKDVEWLRSMHDEMHADPRHTMRFAHTHTTTWR